MTPHPPQARPATRVTVPRGHHRLPAMGASLAVVAALSGCSVDRDGEVVMDEYQRVCVDEETADLPPEQWVYLPSEECDDDYKRGFYGTRGYSGLRGGFLVLPITHPGFGKAPSSAIARSFVSPGTPSFVGGAATGNRVSVAASTPAGRAGLSSGVGASSGG